MIAMLIFASMLWGDGTFFDHDTMRSYDATDRPALEQLARKRRAYWKLDTAGRLNDSYWPLELGLPLIPGVKEDRLVP